MDTQKPSPSFQFYPADWLSSPHVMMMTPAEEGAYIRLLCYAWADPDCCLPDDDDTLAKLSRLGKRWHGESGKKIKECFKSDISSQCKMSNLDDKSVISPPGKMFNPRMRRERLKQVMWREKSAAGGVTSQKNRRQVEGWLPNGSTNTTTNGSTKAQPTTQPLVEGWFNSSSSSSSSSSKEKEIKEKESPAAASLGAPSQGPLGVGSESPEKPNPSQAEKPSVSSLKIHSLAVDTPKSACGYHSGVGYACAMPVAKNALSRPRCAWHFHVEHALNGIGSYADFEAWHAGQPFLGKIPVGECWQTANREVGVPVSKLDD